MPNKGVPAGRRPGPAGRMNGKGGVRIQRNQIRSPWPQAEKGFRIWLVRTHRGRIAWMPPVSPQRPSCTDSCPRSGNLILSLWTSLLVMTVAAPLTDLTQKCAKHILLGRLDYLKDDPTEGNPFSTYHSIAQAFPLLFRRQR